MVQKDGRERGANLLSEIAGLVDVAISLLLQLVDDLTLLLRLFLVVLNLLLEVLLRLLVQLHQIQLLLGVGSSFQHVLSNKAFEVLLNRI